MTKFSVLSRPSGSRVAEVEHFDVVLPDVADEVRTGEGRPWLAEKHERIGIQSRVHIVIVV